MCATDAASGAFGRDGGIQAMSDVTEDKKMKREGGDSTAKQPHLLTVTAMLHTMSSNTQTCRSSRCSVCQEFLL